MVIDNKDGVVSRDLRNSGVWETSLTRVFRTMVKEGDKVLNVGSQTGFEALMMAKEVGPQGKVYIFEPYSFSYRIMRKSVYLKKVVSCHTCLECVMKLSV